MSFAKCEELGQVGFGSLYHCVNKDYGIEVAMKEVDYASGYKRKMNSLRH